MRGAPMDAAMHTTYGASGGEPVYGTEKGRTDHHAPIL